MNPAEWATVVGVAAAVLASMVAALGWYIRTTVRTEIGAATKSIQPGYRNGGQSLADVAAKVDRLTQLLEGPKP